MPTDPAAASGNPRSDPPAIWRAFAKINEELRVFGRGPDGYHEVRTVLSTIDLADEIRVSPAPDFRFSTTGGPSDETNLVVRAVRAFEQARGVKARLHIHLTKNIPSGAGLGGGSADAAVTVMGLDRWFRCERSGPDVLAILGSLGADVPFFAVGGRVLATGRGDVLFPLGVPEPSPEQEPAAVYVLVHPGQKIETAEAYRWFDESMARGVDSRLTETHEYTTIFGFCARFAPLLGMSRPGPASCLNDFELPLFRRFPELAEIKGRLVDGGAVVAAVSGSGSTLFGRFDDPAVASRTADALGRDYNVSLVRSLGRREYFSRVFVQ